MNFLDLQRLSLDSLIDAATDIDVNKESLCLYHVLIDSTSYYLIEFVWKTCQAHIFATPDSPPLSVQITLAIQPAK